MSHLISDDKLVLSALKMLQIWRNYITKFGTFGLSPFTVQNTLTDASLIRHLHGKSFNSFCTNLNIPDDSIRCRNSTTKLAFVFVTVGGKLTSLVQGILLKAKPTIIFPQIYHHRKARLIASDYPPKWGPLSSATSQARTPVQRAFRTSGANEGHEQKCCDFCA